MRDCDLQPFLFQRGLRDLCEVRIVLHQEDQELLSGSGLHDPGRRMHRGGGSAKFPDRAVRFSTTDRLPAHQLLIRRTALSHEQESLVQAL